MRQATIETLVAHNGAAAWYNTLLADKQSGYPNAMGYKPNVNTIIERYCKAYLQMQIPKVESELQRKLMKSDLFDYIPVPDPQEMFLHVAYIYNLEIVCKLMDDTNTERYKNFSWEQFSVDGEK